MAATHALLQKLCIPVVWFLRNSEQALQCEQVHSQLSFLGDRSYVFAVFWARSVI